MDCLDYPGYVLLKNFKAENDQIETKGDIVIVLFKKISHS